MKGEKGEKERKKIKIFFLRNDDDFSMYTYYKLLRSEVCLKLKT